MSKQPRPSRRGAHHFSGRSALVLGSALAVGFSGCIGSDTGEGDTTEVRGAIQEWKSPPPPPPSFTVFAFATAATTSGVYPDGDVRLENVSTGASTWDRDGLQLVKKATILVDDGVDVVNGGHNFASGQGIESAADSWEIEGPATVTPISADLTASLANFNLSSIVVTRENVGTASEEIEFQRPTTTFFFWERGDDISPTKANSDVLVEALDEHGNVIATHKLLRSEYTPSGIRVTTWNGSFNSPTTPDGVQPPLGAAGLKLSVPARRLRLTSVQQAAGGVQDQGPDLKVIAAEPGAPSPSFTVFPFTTTVSTSGLYGDGDVRLERVTAGSRSWSRRDLQVVRKATILVDNGVDAVNGGHNFASGQGIESVPDPWEIEGPATVTPTSADLTASLANFNLTSIVVTRENVGTASEEIEFARPTTTFFFWERGDDTSPTNANSDVLVEALDDHGDVFASHKLLRSEYTPSGVRVTTWNGAFKSPSTPDGVQPPLGAAGLRLVVPTKRLRLTSVQQAAGGIQDQGPDLKIVGAEPTGLFPRSEDDAHSW